jgi:hypothetical protein
MLGILREYSEARLFGFGRSFFVDNFFRAVLVEDPHLFEILLTNGDDPNAGGFLAKFTLEAKAEFLAEVAVEFTEEGAELNAGKTIVHTDVGGASAEFVVFDVVDEETRHLGTAAADGLGFEDASVAIFSWHGVDRFTI